jgi:hypothetical protein
LKRQTHIASSIVLLPDPFDPIIRVVFDSSKFISVS